jgi:ATP-dependent DNA helicase RecG
MTPEEFQKLIAGGESEQLEFIAGTPAPETLARVVCAFLNDKGGRVFIGVGEKGRVTGIGDIEGMIRHLEAALLQSISPRALWTIEAVPVGGDSVVLVEVPEGRDKPYVGAGGIFFRRGERVVAATRDEISDLIQKRVLAGLRWERQIALGADQKDLDEKLVRETARMAAKSERWTGPTDDAMAFLHALGLVVPNGVTNAALLLFGHETSRFLPQMRVRLVVMSQGKTGDHYDRDQTFDGCLLRMAAQIPEALNHLVSGVQSNLATASWEREESVRYPSTALREGVMNALAHRDYSANGSVIIAVGPDSLSITNPGGLPEQLKPTDLKKDHSSVPRNPDISHVFFLRRLIEKLGRGTQRIVEDCKKAGLKEPKWTSSALETRLTFFSKRTSGSTTPLRELNDRQKTIMAAVRNSGRVKIKELEAMLGGQVTERTVRSDLTGLVDGGALIRRGRGRSTSYVLPESV